MASVLVDDSLVSLHSDLLGLNSLLEDSNLSLEGFSADLDNLSSSFSKMGHHGDVSSLGDGFLAVSDLD